MSIQWPPNLNTQIFMGCEPSALFKGLEGDGVITVLTLSAAGTDMDVDVASGQAIVNGTLQNNAGGSVTLSTSDPTNPRWDLITLNSSNQLGKVDGTPGASPAMPDYPANAIILGAAYVGTGVSVISTNNLRYRGRVVLSDEWRHTSDLSKIDGAKLYNGSIDGETKLADNSVTGTQIDESTLDLTTAKYADTSLYTDSQNTTATSYVDMPNMTLTKTMSGGPVMVLFFCKTHGDTVGDTGWFRILRDATTIAEGTNRTTYSTASEGRIISFPVIDVPSSGSRTYKAQWRMAGTGTLYIQWRRLAIIDFLYGGSL